MTGNSFINDALSKPNHLCKSLFEDNNAKDVILDDGKLFVLLFLVSANVNLQQNKSVLQLTKMFKTFSNIDFFVYHFSLDQVFF